MKITLTATEQGAPVDALKLAADFHVARREGN